METSPETEGVDAACFYRDFTLLGEAPLQSTYYLVISRNGNSHRLHPEVCKSIIL